MKTWLKISFIILLLSGIAAGGYWLGARANVAAKPDTTVAKAERKILYYRNPMGLPDTSPTPKKDAMGMDYVAVYDGDNVAASQLNLSAEKIQKLGVKSEAVTLRELNKTVRITGRIEIDESRTYTIAPKFEGWVERLYVNTSGQAVSKGQPLFEVYSPELVSAQREYALAAQSLAGLKNADDETKQSMQQLADASRARLKNWDIAAENSKENTKPRATFRAPVSGIVLEKKAVQGMRFMPGEVLYQIADLSSVWVIAEVPEQDIAQVQLGSRAQVSVTSYPELSFEGKVNFIYPTLNSATRTVQVRMEIQNPKGLLKPAMFASAQIAVSNTNKVLTVPTSAVIDSGTRQVVLVRLAEGRFEPRAVMLGRHSDDFAEVLSGVTEGEQVVTAANFLLDAESNLQAALSGLKEPTLPRFAPIVAVQTEQKIEAATPKPKSKIISHQARGKLEALNADGTVSITHEPIKSLSWPGMTMDFALANSGLLAGIPVGSKITFELVERKPDEWVITKISLQHEEHEHAH